MGECETPTSPKIVPLFLVWYGTEGSQEMSKTNSMHGKECYKDDFQITFIYCFKDLKGEMSPQLGGIFLHYGCKKRACWEDLVIVTMLKMLWKKNNFNKKRFHKFILKRWKACWVLNFSNLSPALCVEMMKKIKKDIRVKIIWKNESKINEIHV